MLNGTHGGRSWINNREDIYCLKHLTDVNCWNFEDGTGFKLRFTFDIKANKYFADEIFIKIYEVPNLLLDDEPILKNVTGCDKYCREGRRLTYRDVKKKQRSKIGRRAGHIRTVNKRESTDSFFHFFRWAWFYFQVNHFSILSLSWQVSLSHAATRLQPTPFNTPISKYMIGIVPQSYPTWKKWTRSRPTL